MYVTVLPVSSTTYFCSPKSNSTSLTLIAKHAFQLMSGFGLSINGKHTYCGDYIYSGHTVMLVLGYLVISECKFINLIVRCNSNPNINNNNNGRKKNCLFYFQIHRVAFQPCIGYHG